MNDLSIVPNGAMAIQNGRIIKIGTENDILACYDSERVLDAQGRIITPGFVDPHTHPVFLHTREQEFRMRLEGQSYVEIAKAGGGIRSTIASTKNADEELLYQLALKRIKRMISLGTTTLEAKSGYGLSTESELKQLRVIGKLSETLPIDIVPTFLGAHEFPVEYKNDHQTYIDILVNDMLPAVVRQGIAKYCDIFTEAHVFSISESRQILSRAKDLGLGLKMHADEIEPIGGAELAAEMKCVSADHLGAISENGLRAIKESGTIPVLLPATLFSLRSKNYAPARKMIDMGLPVAIATDYNPGSCNCDSMSMVITLSCLQMGMSPSEALCAATINAAYAVGMGDSVGSLQASKYADFIIWDIPSIDFIPYHFGSSHIEQVYKLGQRVFPD